MDSIIKNEDLNVTISSFGAEILSIKDKNKDTSNNIVFAKAKTKNQGNYHTGHLDNRLNRGAHNIEYLWQGDEKYWTGRSPVLFPYVGRLTEGKYKLDSKIYSMRIHGLAQYYEHQVVDKKENSITYEFKSNDETLKQYPREFVLRVTYSVIENRLFVQYNVQNLGMNTMYFGIGGHPGFNVPIENDKKFEDYFIRFKKSSNIRKVCFSDTCFPTGKYEDFELNEGGKLPLRHDLFDNDAIVLTDMGDEVTLECYNSPYKVKVRFENIPYLGLWHRPKTDAPYVCIEPWCTLPSREGIIEDLETQPGLIKLESKGSYDIKWSMEFI